VKQSSCRLGGEWGRAEARCIRAGADPPYAREGQFLEC